MPTRRGSKPSKTKKASVAAPKNTGTTSCKEKKKKRKKQLHKWTSPFTSPAASAGSSTNNTNTNRHHPNNKPPPVSRNSKRKLLRTVGSDGNFRGFVSNPLNDDDPSSYLQLVFVNGRPLVKVNRIKCVSKGIRDHQTRTMVV